MAEYEAGERFKIDNDDGTVVTYEIDYPLGPVVDPMLGPVDDEERYLCTVIAPVELQDEEVVFTESELNLLAYDFEE